MISSDLWIYIDSRLAEILMMIPENAFAGYSVMFVAYLLQLPSGILKREKNITWYCNIFAVQGKN